MRNPNPLGRTFFRPLVMSILALALVRMPVLAGVLTTPISSTSSYPDGGDPDDPEAVTACNGAPQTGILYRNSEAEPQIAVNRYDPDNMIAVWIQDAWSTGGGQGLGAAFTKDGGMTWTPVNIPFSRCSGAEPGSPGDFQRAADPWISFSPDGSAHYMALVADKMVGRNGMISATSRDGGVTWEDPVAITLSPAQDPPEVSPTHDKNALTADPFDSDLVYATWTLFVEFPPPPFVPLLFSRSTNGGRSWEKPRPVNTIGIVAPAELEIFHQASQIVVLPDGTLVNVFYRVLVNRVTGQTTVDQAIFRSSDQGRHWEKTDQQVSEFIPAAAHDFEKGALLTNLWVN
jgi:hypothetical protein